MCAPPPCSPLRELIPPPRYWSFVAAITKTLACASVLAFGLPAQANEPQEVFDHWGAHTFGIESCAGVLERPGNELSTAVDCVSNQVFSGLLDVAFQFADKYGKSLFGEHFRLDRRLTFSASGGGLSGELDAVIPLNSFTSVSGDRVTRALFFQNGLTRWRDEHGFQRNDARFGMVHRIAMSERPDAGGVFGTSVFFQENLERGHGRIVTGLDYSDGWGSGSLSYFMPVTDWRPGRFGYEERTLKGVEFKLRSDITRTIELEAAAGRWESKDGSGNWLTRGRLGIRWQPHPWFGLRGNWDDIGIADDSLGLYVAMTVPFGGGNRSLPRWVGLGRRDLGPTEFDQGSLWNSVETVGRIEVAERRSSLLSGDDNTGEEIPLPPTLPEIGEWSQDDVLNPSDEEE